MYGGIGELAAHCTLRRYSTQSELVSYRMRRHDSSRSRTMETTTQEKLADPEIKVHMWVRRITKSNWHVGFM